MVNLKNDLNSSVLDWKTERDHMMHVLRERLHEAQNRMKQNEDKKRVDKSYQVGEMVYLKLQPYRQQSVMNRRCMKLSSRYFGPYKILERIGAVAYKLDLPEGSKVHPVFHVSQLKQGVPKPEQLSLVEPVVGQDGQLLAHPEQILGRRLVPKGNRAITQVLVSWSNRSPGEATWEDYWRLKKQFPGFDP